MPASTEKQRKMFQIALAIKHGHKIQGKGPAAKIARTVGEQSIRDFAGSVATKKRKSSY